MAITTVLATFVALRWGYRPWAVYLFNGALLVVDLVFFAANTTKLFEGGWFPLLLSVAITFVMLTWRKGRRLVQAARAHLRISTSEFLTRLGADPPLRVPGVAVFMAASPAGVPRALLHHLKHNRVLQEQLLLVSVLFVDVPCVPDEGRVEVIPIEGGMRRVILRFGFMEAPDVPKALHSSAARAHLPDLNLEDATYYVGRHSIIPSERRYGMAVWREMLFAVLNRNTELSVDYFCIPVGQVFEVGIPVEI